jgi:hypothetical protein
MAYKKVVTNSSSFVRQMVEFVQGMTEQKGVFALAMLLPSESGLSDKWNLVLSAPWIDREGGIAAIPTITSVLRPYLSKSSASKIERVSVLPINAPLVATMENFHFTSGEAHLIQAFPKAEGAIVFVAEPPKVQAAHSFRTVQTRA